MLEWFNVNIVNMLDIIPFSNNGMFPIAPLPQIRQERIWMHSTRMTTAMEGGCQMPRSARRHRVADKRSVRGKPLENIT